MRMIWEEKDVNGGIVVGRWDIKERWIISYRPDPDVPGNSYSLTSLSDGLVVSMAHMSGKSAGVTRAAMADALSASRYVPVAILAWDGK